MASKVEFLDNEHLLGTSSTYSEPAWWKEGTIFQIWPASFCDSNGDGIGDLGGILSKVDYLKDLGADILWLSPIYKSPNHDFGYDVADYRAIQKEYGTVEDVEALIKELAKRNMKLMMDLVVNHTSDEHQWFQESRKSKDNPKRDWYIWRPPKYNQKGERQPPNNWVSFFGGSAWEYDEATDEYFLHLFTKEQPDLNWDVPAVRAAVHDIMRFWLDKGVAGFRMDVINETSKTYLPNGDLPDAEIKDPNSQWQPAMHLFCDGPRVHEFIRELHEEVLSHYDTVTVGETPHVKDLDRVLKWVHPARRELRMCFQFEFHDLDGDIQVPLIPKKWELPDMKACVNKWQSYMHARGGWNSNYLENHDQARSVSRWGNDSPEFRKSSAKMLALFHASLGGTIYVYQGQELGMKNIPEDWPIEDYLDVATKNYYRECSEATSAGRPSPTPAQVLQWASIKSRDCARTPVQWDASPNAGFTTGKPWMRVNDDYREWNAEQQSHDADSVRAFWKRMLRLRKGCRPLVYGNFNLLEPTNPKLFAYVRNLEGSPSVLVVLNFSDGDLDMTIDPDAAKTAQKDLEYKAAGELADLSALETRAKLVIGTHEAELKATDANGFKGQSTTLKAREGRLYTLAK